MTGTLAAVTGGPSPVTSHGFPGCFSEDNRALCPSFPHRKQWLQLSFPCAVHCWHLPLTSGLADSLVSCELAQELSGVELTTGVRTFSYPLFVE